MEEALKVFELQASNACDFIGESFPRLIYIRMPDRVSVHPTTRGSKISGEANVLYMHNNIIVSYLAFTAFPILCNNKYHTLSPVE